MAGSGYIYVLSNPAFHALKIGYTTKTPKARAAELSRVTGCPAPYTVEWSLFVYWGVETLEKNVHRRLYSKRPNKDREFFDVSIEEAKELITQLAGPRVKPRERRSHADPMPPNMPAVEQYREMVRRGLVRSEPLNEPPAPIEIALSRYQTEIPAYYKRELEQKEQAPRGFFARIFKR